MKQKWALISTAILALVGGIAAALTAAPSPGGPSAGGPAPALPLIFSTQPEGAHAHVPAGGLRNDRAPKVLVTSPGAPLTLTGLVGSRRAEETSSVTRLRVSCWVWQHVSYTPYQRVVLPAYLDPTVPPETTPVTATLPTPPCTATAGSPDGPYSGTVCVLAGAREGADLAASCQKFLVADGPPPGPRLPAAGAAGVVPLWRAVTEAERKSLEEKGAYGLVPGLEGKYFFPTREQAENFRTLAEERGWGTYVVTEAEIDARHLAKAEAIAAAGEGPAFFLREGLVKLVRLVRIIR
ncbi:hypothetical protein MF672_050010 [Actinomadura sp. ATCC 31491]|uniref:SPOR domain-containing protein n=1 Tax=Actinomadura luzonensis TaxID=2805427 RepID=A0ABT0GCP2_9ACTN|nr:hypothetical protein [Actinomadura luzonensis]MCK2221893.1 hypothetical protein [Actinomadura luzonensis]